MESPDDLIFYVQFHIKPESVQEWKDAVTEVIEHMSQEHTFVYCSMHQDTQDTNRFTLYERWNEPSVEAFVRNQMEAKSYRRAYEDRLPSLLQSPRIASILLPLKEWSRG